MDDDTTRREADLIEEALDIDDVGRRSATFVSRRKFLRMGIIGSAMASAAIMTRDAKAATEFLSSRPRSRSGLAKTRSTDMRSCTTPRAAISGLCRERN